MGTILKDCSNCGERLPKKLYICIHDCPHCGCRLDRNQKAAINIKNRAVGQSVLKAKRLRARSPDWFGSLHRTCT
ncbi:MAG: transposase [Desertifilum sp.]|nr:transposase [Desertifilum sp.]